MVYNVESSIGRTQNGIHIALATPDSAPEGQAVWVAQSTPPPSDLIEAFYERATSAVRNVSSGKEAKR